MINIQNSPIDNIKFNNYTFLIKRDDLLHPDFNGNKARKFYHYLTQNLTNIDTIISYGSNQSNAMYSLSVLAKLYNLNFIYYTNHLPDFLKQNPIGNLKNSLDNGMQLIVGEYDKYNINIPNPQTTLLINEGGAIQEASIGIKLLANEINNYVKQHNLKDIKIFLPSGTGTTALFLQKYTNIEVLTCSCVGDDNYLQKQFLELEKEKNNHPTILPKEKKFHFGKLYRSNYNIWLQLKEQTNIEFDLLYDPIGWQTLFYNQDKINLNNILYIHQGGVKGNITMLQRYQRKFDK